MMNGIHGAAKVIIYTGASGKLYFSLTDLYGVYRPSDAADLVTHIASMDYSHVTITVYYASTQKSASRCKIKNAARCK